MEELYEEICGCCNGSGEGRASDTTCSYCRGSGMLTFDSEGHLFDADNYEDDFFPRDDDFAFEEEEER